MELVTTPAGGRLRWTDRASYAPTAWINVPDAPEGCSLHLLYTLPPTVFFDPYTARCTPPVVDRHLWGSIDLEHMPGWASESRWAVQIEKTPPAWWEGDSPHVHAPCTGSACEHTALLLDLEHGGEVRVPLHVRYAHAVPMPLPDPDKHWPEALRTFVQRLHSQALSAWARRTLDAVQRGFAAAQPWLATPTTPQALFADVPVVLAQCASPPPQWQTIGTFRPLTRHARPLAAQSLALASCARSNHRLVRVRTAPACGPTTGDERAHPGRQCRTSHARGPCHGGGRVGRDAMA